MISKFKKKSIFITIMSTILVGVICIICLTNPKISEASEEINTEVSNVDDLHKEDEEETDKKEEDNKESEEVEEEEIENIEKEEKKEEEPIKEEPKKEEKPITENNNTKPASDKVYKSKMYNMSFTIPSDWDGKYTVAENKDGITFYYKLQDPAYKGQNKNFLTIRDKSQVEGAENMSFEVLPNCPTEIKVNGKTYMVTSPTDTVPTSYDVNEYSKMCNGAYRVVNSAR